MIDTQLNPAMKETEPFIEQFKALDAPVGQPSWLLPLRKGGMARFAELGFPTVQHEDWRFTNLAPLSKLPFRPAPMDGAGLNLSAIGQFNFTQIPGSRLVFVNGRFAKELSVIGALPDGVIVSSLATALVANAAVVEKHLGRYVKTEDNALAALNTALFEDGGFIYVPAGKTVAEPVHLLFVTTAKDAGVTVQPRNLIVAEAGSVVTVIESHVTTVKGAYFSNSVTEIFAGDNSQLEHIKFQDEALEAFHVATVQGRFLRNSRVSTHSFAFGARLSRINLRTKLDGENIEAVLNGLYITRGEQLADHHMIVEHAQPRCASHEYFNGILDDKSKGVFHGRILVHPIAQKTDAKQTNKNILLSDDATADTKPQLEIYADDVKCTHGATIGQMDPDSIFYLRARGIGLERAKRMLVHSFAGEIIARVKCQAVREELDTVAWDRLEQNPRLSDQ